MCGLCQANCGRRTKNIFIALRAGAQAGRQDLGQRLKLGQQITADVWAALRCLEETDLDDAPEETLLAISVLAGELAKALDSAFGCRTDDDDDSESAPAIGVRTDRSAGRSPSE
jgi:hypothetical protein